MFKLTIIDQFDLTSDHYRKGDFRDLVPEKDYDCVITPGNAFGIMDGGFDKVVADKFPILQKFVWEGIERYRGNELAVGQPIHIFITQSLQVIYSPTMRFPGPVESKDAPYVAALHAFAQIKKVMQHTPTKIENVVMPLFGTVTGGVPPESSLAQIEYAYERIFAATQPAVVWSEDLREHRKKLKNLCDYTNLRTGV